MSSYIPYIGSPLPSDTDILERARVYRNPDASMSPYLLLFSITNTSAVCARRRVSVHVYGMVRSSFRVDPRLIWSVTCTSTLLAHLHTLSNYSHIGTIMGFTSTCQYYSIELYLVGRIPEWYDTTILMFLLAVAKWRLAHLDHCERFKHGDIPMSDVLQRAKIQCSQSSHDTC